MIPILPMSKFYWDLHRRKSGWIIAAPSPDIGFLRELGVHWKTGIVYFWSDLFDSYLEVSSHYMASSIYEPRKDVSHSHME